MTVPPGAEGRARALVDTLVRLSTQADPGAALSSWGSPLPRELREAVASTER